MSPLKVDFSQDEMTEWMRPWALIEDVHGSNPSVAAVVPEGTLSSLYSPFENIFCTRLTLGDIFKPLTFSISAAS